MTQGSNKKPAGCGESESGTFPAQTVLVPRERYPAISVATLPTRWSADADPLPHLRLGPRIQTPGTPVLFAPACQRTTSRFHGQNASELEDAPLVNPSRLPAGDHRAAVWALLPRVGVTDMWNAFSPDRAACAESSKRRGHKETRTLLLTSATCTIAKRDAILRPCTLTAFGASGGARLRPVRGRPAPSIPRQRFRVDAVFRSLRRLRRYRLSRHSDFRTRHLRGPNRRLAGCDRALLPRPRSAGGP